MHKINILIVANQGTNNTELLSWYENADQYNLTLADSDERAIELAQRESFDLVLADGTDLSINVKKLEALLPILNQEVQLITYAGESVQVLDEKINAILDQKKVERTQRLLVLDSSRQPFWENWKPFSAN